MKTNTDKESRLPASLLNKLLHYEPTTGAFTWRVDRSGMVKAGSKAGTINSFGYVTVQINKTPYFAHRLAWLYMTGKWPENHVDHIDGNKANNIFSNLRDVTPSVNRQNIKTAFKTNKSGCLGVKQISSGFEASINASGQYHYLGIFKTKEAASAAYVIAKRQLHAGCTI